MKLTQNSAPRFCSVTGGPSVWLAAGIGLLVGLCALAAPASAATAELPADANVLNVKNFGAVGNGVNDDTAAIQAAVRAFDTQQPPNTRYTKGIWNTWSSGVPIPPAKVI